MNITSKELIAWNVPNGPEFKLCLTLIESLDETTWTNEKIKAELEMVFADPTVKGHPEFDALRDLVLERRKSDVVEIAEVPKEFALYGGDGIEEGAFRQMNNAMRLPITKAGALMPDAHQGYGLPIGGVLATENAIIPYGVGVDIGCRMCLSVFDIQADFIEANRDYLKTMLNRSTKFGRATFKKPQDHEVLAHPLFDENPLLKGLQKKAAEQIGSSGGGNHFVEFGICEILDENNEWNLSPGKYLSLLSHSGSRGFGATIANHYTKLAMAQTKLPDEVRHLAWLDLNSEAGQEYWLAMNLAGDYASACHHQIHAKVARDLQVEPAARVENHHNFAWKETLADGTEVIVHRKGATPAGKGVLGIIPGSMTAPGFIVRGKGDASALNSASHGAGRAMSRTQAKNSLDASEVAKHLKDHGIDLIGSGLDEAPMAYKNIHEVMDAQKDLVDVVGTFLPKVVRMCGDEFFKEVD
ncbi:MAG: RtcB family protein [Bacteroidetes bacterium]|nr:MAG: RtcB family protein [Bacteroidota bacterium]